MAEATNKRLKTAIIPQSAVDQASVFLQHLPDKPKETLSLREAIEKLRGQIKAALTRGYGYEEVTELLRDKGINISASTLKSYLSSGTRKSFNEEPIAAKPRRRRKQADSEEEISSDSFANAAPSHAAAIAAEPALMKVKEPVEAIAPPEASAATENTEAPTPATTTRRRGRTSSTAASEKPAEKPTTKSGSNGRSRSAAKESAPKPTTRSTTRRKKTAQD